MDTGLGLVVVVKVSGAAAGIGKVTGAGVVVKVSGAGVGAALAGEGFSILAAASSAASAKGGRFLSPLGGLPCAFAMSAGHRSARTFATNRT